MDDDNPFQAPQEASGPPGTPAWTGIAVLVFAAVVYAPMTVLSLVRAISNSWTMLGAFALNAVILAGLVWLGTWLIRRSRRYH
jgi:hypothetical protein